MENLKKSRSSLRGLFTKAVNKLEEYFLQEQMSRKKLNTYMANIEQKAFQIADLDQRINDFMLATVDIPLEDFESEHETCSGYQEKLYYCRCAVDDILAREAKKNMSDTESVTTRSEGKIKKYKLPKIEITKFGGEIKEWLTFWAQFEKIHEDDELANEDKFHYLRQSTAENSKAREVVDSFPMTGANYQKAINHMKSRFGNKDTLVEMYVRELLKLVLANALNPIKKIVVSTLYDKLETQLRALESLEVTRDKLAAILYPLVESCLPEELLRGWERHRIVPIPSSSTENARTDRLSHLMIFLQGEVESEERIALARSGFADQTKKTKKEEKSQEPSTAAGLFVQSKGKSKCIFCDNSKHFSNNCVIGKRMSLDQRYKVMVDQKACNICLSRGHEPKNCKIKSKVKCDDCEGNHWRFMCPGKVQNSTGTTIVASNLASINTEIVQNSTNNLLAKPSSTAVAVLSTFMFRIHNGKKTQIVRAAVDSGSHKSYLLTRIIKKLALIKNGEERLTHELFGGHQTKEKVHNRYTVLAENLDGTKSLTFEVLEQDRICHNVPKLNSGPWIDELKSKGIELTDFGTGASEIEMLIGNDVAGKLLVDMYKFEESGSGNGLVALNYTISWALMDQMSYHTEATDAALLIQTLFVQEVDVSRLWRLDVIGIEDAAETKKKEQSIDVANQYFKNTLAINSEGRFEVALPFINSPPPTRTNRNLAKKRLHALTRKLSPELNKVYQEIFNKWEAAGIIEKVPLGEANNHGHYLPHKAVLKPNSLTTPVRPVFDASAKERKQMSLNDCLEKGPNLLEIITSVVSRFRLRAIGVLSDIEKAFLQLSIRPDDRDNVRFLWWEEDSSDQIVIYRHRRVVFGLTCSSFLLAATINHILDHAPAEYRNTVDQLRNANYVDNCVTSLYNEEAVIKFKDEATKILATGKLNLRDWEWNSPSNVRDKEISVLGLTWNLKDDTLTCDIIKRDLDGDGPITKRKILSDL